MKIKIRLDEKSISDAIKQIEDYKNSLVDKQTTFLQKLAEAGIPVVDANMNAPGDSDPSHYTYVKIDSYQEFSRARLVVEGRDLLFIEFGAGVHYNGAAGTSPHPKGGQLGFTIGSYGQGKGANDSWSYEADSGEWVRSYGTQATMPVYKASLEIRQKVKEIAKQVYATQ